MKIKKVFISLKKRLQLHHGFLSLISNYSFGFLRTDSKGASRKLTLARVRILRRRAAPLHVLKAAPATLAVLSLGVVLTVTVELRLFAAGPRTNCTARGVTVAVTPVDS